MRTIAIVNQKGGCGKTTSAINLAGVFASRRQPTLLVDLDPQSHCAASLAIPEQDIDLHIGDALLAEPNRHVDDNRLLWRVRRHLCVAPSTVKLAGLEATQGGLATQRDRETRLKSYLSHLRETFTWAILDCAPSIGLLTFNALHAADLVIIPVQTSFLSLHGTRRQLATINSLARRLEKDVPFRLLPTMHDPDSEQARDILKELRDNFGPAVLPTVIRLDHKISLATSLGQPVIEHDPSSWGATDYVELASEVLELRNAPVVTLPEEPDEASPEATSPSIVNPNIPAPRPATLDEPVAGSNANRATEIAERARKLLARTSHLQEQIQARAAGGGSVAHLIEDKSTYEPPENSRARVERLYGTRETSRGVLFVHPGSPSSSICVAGDFNNWNPATTRLDYNPQLGVHEGCIPLKAGMHEYRIVVDGRWITDPFNSRSVTNPFGERNSIIVVTRDPQVPIVPESAD
ncbi:MAG: AAA family ATPase [Phycisphaerales bacterium JB043]